MGTNWKFIFRNLGLSEGEIQQINERNAHETNMKETIYQLLLRWKQNSESPPSIAVLCKLLWSYENRECVYILKKFLKNKKKEENNTS